jgi:hypothetical protein
MAATYSEVAIALFFICAWILIITDSRPLPLTDASRKSLINPSRVLSSIASKDYKWDFNLSISASAILADLLILYNCKSISPMAFALTSAPLKPSVIFSIDTPFFKP